MQSNPIKVGIVNYLNTKPLLHGLQKLHALNTIELLLDYPSKVATALLQNTIDIGLVPIAILPEINNAKIIGNHCIASNNIVASVCLFSNVPIGDIETVYLDYQSRTSVQLVQILFQKYWKKQVQFIDAPKNYLMLINNTTAAVIIGDRAFENLNAFPYVYDLAEAWKKLTNLPFVFAAWVSTQTFSEDFLNIFEQANAAGLQCITEIADAQNYKKYNLEKYYTENITYTLDAQKRESITLFLQYITEL